jgi:hypothetical protein
MKILEIIHQTPFQEVWHEFYKMFRLEDEGVHVTEESRMLYLEVYKELKSTELIENRQWGISIEEITENEFCDSYIDVFGISYNDLGCKYAMEFTVWEEIVSSDYIEGYKLSGEHFTTNEFLAALLYEMTFCGFDQDNIQDLKDQLTMRSQSPSISYLN